MQFVRFNEVRPQGKGEESLFEKHRWSFVEDQIVSLPYPERAAQLSLLAQALTKEIALPCVVVFGALDVFDACEYWPLANAVKKGLGDDRDWLEISHVKDEPGEEEGLNAIISLAFLCLWDMIILEDGHQRTWNFSHDEYVDCWSTEPSQLAIASVLLSGWPWQG